MSEKNTVKDSTEKAAPAFTSGPWEISTTDFGGSEAWPCIRGAMDSTGGWVVALLDQGCVSASDDEPEANARLIAAAPSLYAALKEMSCTCRNDDGSWPHDANNAGCNLTIARAALALVDEPKG